jgi:murein DD-endopeptidase MepM/ murein hydrolase activator NlpD
LLLVLVPVLLLVLLLPACRGRGDFRVQVLPDPVPLDPRTGAAHYICRIESLAPHGVRIGDGGVTLPAQGVLELERDLPAGATSDSLDIWRGDGEPSLRLVFPVPTVTTDVAAEATFPLPDLGGHGVVVTAGFHAPNHRRPGRRLALDLVPALPPGRSAFGLPVLSPVAGQVVAVSTRSPDLPGGLPNEVIVQADDGRVWRFAHFARDSVPLLPGQRLERGKLLGRIGLSGTTTGPHLHMELVVPPGGGRR